MNDPYETLGVDKEASQEAIKKAFRRQAKEHHPDANGDPVKFDAITKAYRIIGDEEKRAYFDETGKEKEQDRVEQMAVQMFCDAFFTVINRLGADVFYSDVFRVVSKELDSLLKKQKAKIKNIKENQENLEKLLKKVHKKKKSEQTPPVIESMLIKAIGDSKALQANEEEGLQVLARAKEMVLWYTFEKDDKGNRPLRSAFVENPSARRWMKEAFEANIRGFSTWPSTE